MAKEIMIFTEGQTDWKHIKKAEQALGLHLNLQYWESPESRGDENLLKLIEGRSIAENDKINIFIFDRDNSKILPRVQGIDSNYKYWGNNVYSFALPIFQEMKNNQSNLCIEFYYKDEDLQRKDIEGRRIFLSFEFDEVSGRHKTISSINYGNVNKLKGITKNNNYKVIDDMVFDDNKKNLALSKNKFAEYVYNGDPLFCNINFSNFHYIFKVIEEIAKDAESKDNKETFSTIPVLCEDACRKDHPPVLDYFVGREELISSLLDPKIRVAAITGLGGEGKSSLAAKIYRLVSNDLAHKKFDEVAWVDCKDLDAPFHDKLLETIEILTNGIQKKTMYAEENVKDSIYRFVDLLNSQKCFIVFDNVDAFVDKDKSIFTGNVKLLFDEITSSLTQSYVIFTCRPSITDYHLSFIEVAIQGLKYDECIDLAAKFDLDTESNIDIFKNIHDKTKGHALWLNLIFGQIRNKRLTIDRINYIVSTQTHFIQNSILDSIWKTLNKNEKEIIDIVGTFTRPPDFIKIEKCTNLTYQKCKKVLSSLVKLRLIIELDKEGETHYDLHPIIKLKSKGEIVPDKKKSLITIIIKVLSFGDWGKLKTIVNISDYYMPDIEDYIQCAEIAIEHKEFKMALEYINQLSEPLLKYGQDVKYIELCDSLMADIDKDKYEIGINVNFTDIFTSYIHTLLEQGEFSKVDRLLENYNKSIKSFKQFMYFIEMQSYNLWFQNIFYDCIILCNDGIDRIIKKGEAVPSNIFFNLALANRDYGNVETALNYFLQKYDLEFIENWDPKDEEAIEISAEVGNLSRCYYLMKQYELSLKYCKKAVEYLELKKDRHSKVNYGYGLLWLGDILIDINEIDAAVSNIDKAIEVWSKYCPSRLSKIENHIKNYPKDIKERIEYKLSKETV